MGRDAHMDFIVGDLVYYVGHSYYGNPYGYTRGAPAVEYKRVGIVVRVDDNIYHTYSVYWLKDEIASNHVANHLELVYNV